MPNSHSCPTGWAASRRPAGARDARRPLARRHRGDCAWGHRSHNLSMCLLLAKGENCRSRILSIETDPPRLLPTCLPAFARSFPAPAAEQRARPAGRRAWRPARGRGEAGALRRRASSDGPKNRRTERRRNALKSLDLGAEPAADATEKGPASLQARSAMTEESGSSNPPETSSLPHTDLKSGRPTGNDSPPRIGRATSPRPSYDGL